MKTFLSLNENVMTKEEMEAYLQTQPEFHEYRVIKSGELEYVNFSLYGYTVECEIVNTRTNKMVKSERIASYVLRSIVSRFKRLVDETDESNIVEVHVSVIDIDNTIADNEHRCHFIHGDKPDWDAFFLACEEDKPISDNIKSIKEATKNSEYVVFLTGRSEICYHQTERWLEKHYYKGEDNPLPKRGEFPRNNSIYMRGSKDYSQDYELKPAMLYEYMEHLQTLMRYKYIKPGAIFTIIIDAIYDDKDSVISEFRKLGYNVVDVKSEEFQNSYKEMNLNMIGTGNLFSETKGNSYGYMLVDKTLVLVDAGRGALELVKDLLKDEDIDSITICVTHTHPDHVSELMDICYYVYFSTKLKIIVHDYDADDSEILERGVGSRVHSINQSTKHCTVRNLMNVSGITPEFVENNVDWHNRISIMSNTPYILYLMSKNPRGSVLISSFKQRHAGVDVARGYSFLNKTPEGKNLIIYSGDARDTSAVRNLIETLNDSFNTISVYHEASTHETKAHSHVSEVLRLFDDITCNPSFKNTNLKFYMYHLEDEVMSAEEILTEEFKHLIGAVTVL